jgi:DNA-binding protein YbaB
MTEITGEARAHRGAIAVEVFPGGALSSITLSDRALALDRRELAASILDAVAEATALANERTKHALRDALTGLGLDSDPALLERVEATTPQTWRL